MEGLAGISTEKAGNPVATQASVDDELRQPPRDAVRILDGYSANLQKVAISK